VESLQNLLFSPHILLFDQILCKILQNNVLKCLLSEQYSISCPIPHADHIIDVSAIFVDLHNEIFAKMCKKKITLRDFSFSQKLSPKLFAKISLFAKIETAFSLS
jgi:hypothetical protein